MMKHSFRFLFLSLVFCWSFQAQATESAFRYYKLDISRKMIIVNQGQAIPLSSSTIVVGSREYVLEQPVAELKPGAAYSVLPKGSQDAYTLYISTLPILDIRTKDNLPIADDADYVESTFRLVDHHHDNMPQYNLAIRVRGGTSRQYPKKSYRLEFRQENDWKTTRDVRLLGMRNDDDWNLQALYNEPMRLRSRVCFELWQEMHRPHYQDREPEASAGIDMRYVDVFINDVYRGIYCLSERVDRKQLKLKKYDDEMRGELYKGIGWGASTFKELPPYVNGRDTWSGFEYKYPDEVLPSWNNPYSFVRFVLQSETDDFRQHYAEWFEENNLIDYFIFLNLIRATDNYGKNIYLARYDKNEPYFYVPWDLDLTFGYVWSAEGLQRHKRASVNDIVTNGFYRRLLEDTRPDGFVAKYIKRWNELRETIITSEHILDLFEKHFDYLSDNGAYLREAACWSNALSINDEEWTYLTHWLNKRIAYLDHHPTGIAPLEQSPKAAVIAYQKESQQLVVTGIEQATRLQVFNIQGQCILNEILKEGVTYLNFEQTTKGIYLAYMQSDKQTDCIKFQVD